MTATSIFKPNIIFHIEDDSNWREIVYDILNSPSYIEQLGNGGLVYVESKIEKQVTDDLALEEVDRLKRDAGDGLAVVSIVTAQIARTFLTYNLPAAIISDTSFPLNGKKVVEWLQAHGYPDYPLIGLSATPIDALEPELHTFFITGNARYFNKATFDIHSLGQQIIYNVGYNRKLYG
jgi:hypothetical protein